MWKASDYIWVAGAFVVVGVCVVAGLGGLAYLILSLSDVF